MNKAMAFYSFMEDIFYFWRMTAILLEKDKNLSNLREKIWNCPLISQVVFLMYSNQPNLQLQLPISLNNNQISAKKHSWTDL